MCKAYRAADLGPVVSDVHGEGLEGLHILIGLHLQLALLADLCNAAGRLLQLTQRLRQGLCQVDLLLQRQPFVQCCTSHSVPVLLLHPALCSGSTQGKSVQLVQLLMKSHGVSLFVTACNLACHVACHFLLFHFVLQLLSIKIAVGFKSNLRNVRKGKNGGEAALQQCPQCTPFFLHFLHCIGQIRGQLPDQRRPNARWNPYKSLGQ